MNRGIIFTFMLITIATGNLLAQSQTSTSPITLQEQGSFAVGGTVLTHPGTFDPVENHKQIGRAHV